MISENPDSGRKIMVTGGAGFIGSELVKQLVLMRNQVVVVDNLVNGKTENLDPIPGDSLEIIIDDIRNLDLMARLLKTTDIVFHLACLGVRHSLHSPLENHEVNASATLNLLKLSREASVKKFVYVSSSEVYGTAQWAPIAEETHPAFPMTVYGASKLAGECYTRAFFRSHGFSTVVVRPFNSFGPHCHHEGDSGEVIPKFLLRSLAGKPMIIFGDGNQTRDFTFVSDTAAGILSAGFNDQAIGETINLGSGREISILDLAKEISNLVSNGKADILHEKPRPGDVLRLCADTTKSQKILGFSPQVTLQEGLMKLKEWYENKGTPPADLLRSEIVRNWESPALRK